MRCHLCPIIVDFPTVMPHGPFQCFACTFSTLPGLFICNFGGRQIMIYGLNTFIYYSGFDELFIEVRCTRKSNFVF